MVVFEQPISCYYKGNRTYGTKLFSDCANPKQADAELKKIAVQIGIGQQMISCDKGSSKKYLFVMGTKIQDAREHGAREVSAHYIKQIGGHHA